MSEGARADVARWVILGAGGHARAVHDVLIRAGASVLAVAGEAAGPQWPVPVLADDDALLDLARREGASVALGIGGNDPRARVLERVIEAGLNAPAVVAATATVAVDAELGAGAVVLEHAHVGPLARVGLGAVVNTAAVVEHDAEVGDAAHVAPGAVVLGAARVGVGALLGSGARVLPGVVVGDGVVVGAGAVVARDVEAGATVVGIPARPKGARA